MAFPTVQTTAESSDTANTTSHTVTLPTGITSGDLVLIVGGSAGNTVLDALTGWTELLDEALGLVQGKCIYRYCDGTEGSSITLTSGSTRMWFIAYRISGADPANLPEISAATSGTSTAPDAATCTPTGGAKDYLWITFFTQGGEEADDDTWVTGTPANYSNLLQKTTGIAGAPTSNEQGASAQRQLNAASENAGAFTTAQSLAWRAFTVAVHPAPPAATLPRQSSGRRNTIANLDFDPWSVTGGWAS